MLLYYLSRTIFIPSSSPTPQPFRIHLSLHLCKLLMIPMRRQNVLIRASVIREIGVVLLPDGTRLQEGKQAIGEFLSPGLHGVVIGFAGVDGGDLKDEAVVVCGTEIHGVASAGFGGDAEGAREGLQHQGDASKAFEFFGVTCGHVGEYVLDFAEPTGIVGLDGKSDGLVRSLMKGEKLYI